MTDDEPGYDLVMPFLTVASKGGPHDDKAYCAGYEMGHLDALLTSPYQFGLVHRTLQACNREQADLIAMRHGWRAKFQEPDADGWMAAEFIRADPKLHAIPGVEEQS